MPSTLKLRTCELLVQFLPAAKSPGEDLEIFDVVTHIWHMLRRKSFICSTMATIREQARASRGQATHDCAQTPPHLSPWEGHHSLSRLDDPCYRSKITATNGSGELRVCGVAKSWLIKSAHHSKHQAQMSDRLFQDLDAE